MTAPKVVFDCVVFAQAIISNHGPAAACIELARARDIELVWSDYVVAEIRELPQKLSSSLNVTDRKVATFIRKTTAFATLIATVSDVYTHPFDPDDSHYVNLAVAASATLITSRDRHLLNLMDRVRPEALDFQRRFPQLEIISPDELLVRVRGQSP